jgi:hypothetical protein
MLSKEESWPASLFDDFPGLKGAVKRFASGNLASLMTASLQDFATADLLVQL